SYTITADLGALAAVSGEGAKFSFSFSTYPLALRGNLASFTTTEGKDDSYDMVLDLRSPDREEAATVEGLVKFSETVDAVWEHAPDGKQHTLTITGVEAGKAPRYITLSTEKRSGAEKGEIASVRIPAKGEFGIYDVRYVSEPQKYIEAVFTAQLDGRQDMDGLAFIAGEKPQKVEVDGNILKIYPEASQSGTIKVMFTESIRSASGILLNDNLTFEIETESDAPAIKMLGDGVIMPSGGALTVPFRAVYLRGVVAKVIKIPENNMGHFFQNNSINEGRQLVQVGRLVARKTVFFDADISDFTRWGTYAIDLRDIIEPEPGALYRLELSYNRDLNTYPCDDYQPRTREEIMAEEELNLLSEMATYDKGKSRTYYYYYDYDDYDYDYDDYDYDYDWYYYDYHERDNPCSESYYYRKVFSKNILATDLGLIVKGEEGGGMVGMVHNLNTTEPVADAEVTVYNYQNMPVGKGRTDASGKARIAVKGGVPYYVKAASGPHRVYIRTDRGDALSLSTFDVSGEVVRKGIKGFIYGERGVWRPGDTLFLSFMVSDRDGTLPADHPVVLELYNPLGQQYVRRVAPQGSYGIYSFEVPTDPDVPTGSWEAKVTVGGIEFSKRLRIESIKPNRLKIDFNFDDDILIANTNVTANFHTEWLQGATARNLKYEINATVSASKTTFPKYAGYSFDDELKTFDAEQMHFASGTTDENGDAKPSGTIHVGKNSPGMINVMFDTKVYEESGDFSIDVLNRKFTPYKRYVGIVSPQVGKAHLNTKENHKFEVVSLDYKGVPAADVRVEVEVYRVGWYWWYSSSNERLANYLSSSYNRPEKSVSLRTDSNGKGSFDLNFSDSEWGTYYIRVKDEMGGHSAGTLAYFDWPYLQGQRGAEGATAASLLTLKTDRDEYNPGDKILLTFPSSEGSRALVSIENGSKVIGVEQHVCDKGETTIAIKADEDMMPNAYLHVTLIQPHGNSGNDLPIRLYGVVPVTVTSPGSRLRPVLSMKDEILPGSKYEVTVSEEKGRPMAYTLAIVDEGLLDLTRFATPRPVECL
ncbi:MAG: hypothetical protein LIO77_08620, partial [Rikenellaceae bacterium]|nr:hypothetical protein [Rikenellaceae bacterium]